MLTTIGAMVVIDLNDMHGNSLYVQSSFSPYDVYLTLASLLVAVEEIISLLLTRPL